MNLKRLAHRMLQNGDMILVPAASACQRARSVMSKASGLCSISSAGPAAARSAAEAGDIRLDLKNLRRSESTDVLGHIGPVGPREPVVPVHAIEVERVGAVAVDLLFADCGLDRDRSERVGAPLADLARNLSTLRRLDDASRSDIRLRARPTPWRASRG